MHPRFAQSAPTRARLRGSQTSNHATTSLTLSRCISCTPHGSSCTCTCTSTAAGRLSPLPMHDMQDPSSACVFRVNVWGGGGASSISGGRDCHPGVIQVSHMKVWCRPGSIRLHGNADASGATLWIEPLRSQHFFLPVAISRLQSVIIQSDLSPRSPLPTLL